MSTFAGAGAGSFGALGGSITFEWVPDPSVIAGRLMALAGYLENFLPPLEASRGIARRDMQNHFDTETSPDGAAWAPLADSTIERWGEHPILQLTGAMRDAAVSEGAYQIDGHDLFINTSGFPPYWIFHETGREAFAGFSAWAAKMGADVVDPSSGGMPARPFVGISFEAQLQIIEAFDAWFEGGISGFYTRPSGAVQTRTAGGQFGRAITGGG